MPAICTLTYYALLIYLPIGKFKTFVNFNNSFVSICLLIFLGLNEQIKNVFMIKLNMSFADNLYIFQNTKHYKELF